MTKLAQPISQGHGLRERMSPGARRRRQVRVEVDEDRAWDMFLLVFVATTVGLAEVPADVGDAKIRFAETGGEGFG
jgi:hypothetical protein